MSGKVNGVGGANAMGKGKKEKDSTSHCDSSTHTAEKAKYAKDLERQQPASATLSARSRGSESEPEPESARIRRARVGQQKRARTQTYRRIKGKVLSAARSWYVWFALIVIGVFVVFHVLSLTAHVPSIEHAFFAGAPRGATSGDASGAMTVPQDTGTVDSSAVSPDVEVVELGQPFDRIPMGIPLGQGQDVGVSVVPSATNTGSSVDAVAQQAEKTSPVMLEAAGDLIKEPNAGSGESVESKAGKASGVDSERDIQHGTPIQEDAVSRNLSGTEPSVDASQVSPGARAEISDLAVQDLASAHVGETHTKEETSASVPPPEVISHLEKSTGVPATTMPADAILSSNDTAMLETAGRVEASPAAEQMQIPSKGSEARVEPLPANKDGLSKTGQEGEAGDGDVFVQDDLQEPNEKQKVAEKLSDQDGEGKTPQNRAHNDNTTNSTDSEKAAAVVAQNETVDIVLSATPGKPTKFLGVQVGKRGVLDGYNITRLSYMLYRIVRRYSVLSLIDYPCIQNIEWMPDVVDRLDFELPGFVYSCVALSDEEGGRVKEAFVNRVQPDIYIRDPWQDDTVPEGDMLFSWNAIQFWNTKQTWKLILSARKNTKILALSSNPGFDNLKVLAKYSGKADGKIDLRKQPFLLDQADQTIGNLSMILTHRQLLMVWNTSTMQRVKGASF
ncbi:hypothetical protein FVE85_0192 [Porphyridium purpureum]|uniref:Uncharacterized protein n=1 Tax=Porphyridium purpureum TaxID=35688 RepID=A0A5J4Z0T5_PORPP|nr:hypothetical protein FVE85_0192 [Porphyridium purpureum]|eukprot:POR1818..scf208_2